MIEHIEYRGKLIHECTLPGETRADDVFPAHPNAIQVSARRFLHVYATRTYRGGDDDLSIVYQLRDGAYDGPVLAEGILAKSVNDWDPFDDGSAYVRQHGHPVAFGVPRGALIQGQPAPNANRFVAKWRVCARIVDPATGFLVSSRSHPDLSERTQGVEWVQLRLNDAEDDMEIVQLAQPLRQRGYEGGDAFCSAAVLTMNQSFVQAVPFNADASEWADVNHFDGGRLAALKYRYNPQRGVYEWVEMGPLIEEQLFEASLARYRGSWVISGRPHGGGAIGWFRTADPFGAASPSARPTSPVNSSPLTAYTYADGVLRVLTGDSTISPYGLNRNPLYLWDIDPEQRLCGVEAARSVRHRCRRATDPGGKPPHQRYGQATAACRRQGADHRLSGAERHEQRPQPHGGRHHSGGERDGRHLLRCGAVRGGLPRRLAVCDRRSGGKLGQQP